MTILATAGEKGRSDSVVSLGYDLATTYDEPLVVLHVIPEEDFETHKTELERNSLEFQELSLSQEEETAARFSERIVEESLDEYDYERVTPRGCVGDPATAIIDEAKSIEPRFIVIGGQQRSPVGKAIFGSVTQDVLLGSKYPVVTAVLK